MISKKIQFLTLTILFIFATQNHIINADSTLLKNTEIAIDDGTQSKIIKKNFFFYEEGISHLKKSIFDVIQKHRGDVIVIPISLFELSDDAPEKKKESHSHSEKMPAKYDVEYLGNLEQYLKNHPHFVEEPTTEQNQLKLEKKCERKSCIKKNSSPIWIGFSFYCAPIKWSIKSYWNPFISRNISIFTKKKFKIS